MSLFPGDLRFMNSSRFFEDMKNPRVKILYGVSKSLHCTLWLSSQFSEKCRNSHNVYTLRHGMLRFPFRLSLFDISILDSRKFDHS